MTDVQFKQTIYDLLTNLRNIEPLKQLFWSELNYNRFNQRIPRRGWNKAADEALAEDPLLFAAGGKANNFHIIYARLNSEKLLLIKERSVVLQLLKHHPYALFIFSNEQQDRWHFVNVKFNELHRKRRTFRRIVVSPEENLGTATERISLVDLDTFSIPVEALSPIEIQKRCEEAFDIEKVTKQFYENYKIIFIQLQQILFENFRDKVWAHDYAFQLLNRIMFLYFIQRKRWLGDDPKFIRHLWEAYKDSRQPRDTFFENWLSVLFFEAFNKKFQAERKDREHFPPEIRTALAEAPFLNGGLFKPNKLDTVYEIKIPDEFFINLFDRFEDTTPGFLERYNFTISESTPFDVEVAVDPEMIGKVYETLVNVTFEGIVQEEEWGTAGIFYTPRVEIDLMCRLSLVDWLSNHLGEKYKSILYQAVFAYDEEEKQEADNAITHENLWEDLNKLLREITVCDPACGSGSFLVGMLQILDDLQERINNQLGIEETPYERRKRIIGQSLYGVDVMDWAVHVAELRLWLQLVIETELQWWERKAVPLLPNLSFKVRQGDSLVQEVGGINFGLHHAHREISTVLKGKLTRLKGKKLKFYNGEKSTLSEVALKKEELNLFREILKVREFDIQSELKKLKQRINQKPEQMTLPGIKTPEPKQLNMLIEQFRKEIERKENELTGIRQALNALKTVHDIPFVWDVAFVEIFEGTKKGFDIVIGNPPYIRQEKISDPQGIHDNKTYKQKLQDSIAAAYPHVFGKHRLNSKSDMYVYFYLHGLSLLNRNGSFCFITSNSWLDVGYGKDLQEFLLNHCHVKMILDNKVKRSFATADINTIIALFSAPQYNSNRILNKTARFVMFQVPFEQILSPTIFDEIESTTERHTKPEYRVFSIPQEKLFKDGCELSEEEKETNAKNSKNINTPLIKVVRYVGNKWGGKYLRAPDIYWTILEKGKGILVQLGNIAEVRRGITTGANEFFYLDDFEIQKWGIENEFLIPAITSPRELTTIEINQNNLKYKIFLCDKDEKELKNTAALKYIKYGEKNGINNRPTCRARKPWYNISRITTSQALWMKAFNNRYIYPINTINASISDRFYEIAFKEKFHWNKIAASLNNLITILSTEINGRVSLGEGALDNMVYEAKKNLIINPAIIPLDIDLIERDILPIKQELDNNDRIEFEYAILDILKLTKTEKECLFEEVIKLVENRIGKANSL